MPAATVIPVDRGGGGDTFIESLIHLPEAVPDLRLDVVALMPLGVPIEAPNGVRIRYVRSARLHRWLWKHREGKNPIASFFLLCLTAYVLSREALRLSRETRYDLIYAAGGPIAGLAGIRVKRKLRLPLAMHFQFTYHFSAAKPLMRKIVRAFYEQADALIGNCPMLGKDAVALGVPTRKCHWVFNWIDQDLFRPYEQRGEHRARFGITDEQTAFFFGGRFDDSKHVDRLIRALTDFHDPRAVFLFAGDGVLAGELASLAAHDPNIRLLGTVPRHELPSVHAAADVQLWGSVDIDYPGLVVMEAMSSGLAVFTSEETMNAWYDGAKVDPSIIGAPLFAKLFPPTTEGIHAAIREAIARRNELNAIRHDVAAFARRSFGLENAFKLVEVLRGVCAPP